MKQASIWCFAVLLAGGLAFADAPRVGVVSGTVLDPEGQPMPGATVQLISDRGTESTVSDGEGEFKFVFVIPDEYTVRADLEGFQYAEGMIVVAAGGRADVVLGLSEVAADEIVVTGESPLINKFDVSGGGVVEAKEMENIIAPARWHQTVLQYFPGVTQSMEGGAGAKDVEGGNAERNTYYIDGVDTSFGRSGGTSTVRLPNLAVSQLQMFSSRADAEYSRSMGGITTMVVKSGTNDFHGTAAATFINLAWNDQYDLFPVEGVPDAVDLGWELAIGGPLKRDKLWFFLSAADQGYPYYAVLQSGDQLEADVTHEPKVAKLDFRPSQAHSLSLTLSDTPATFPYIPTAFMGDRYAGSDFLQGGEFGTLRWSWAINDDLFLDTSFAYQETFDDRDVLYERENDPSAHPSSPAANNDITYVDLASGLYYNSIAIALGVGTITYPRTQGNVALNWFAGNHDLKFGLDYQETGWDVYSKKNPDAYGYYYNPQLPGGFVVPAIRRDYAGTADVGGVESKSETWGLFVRDRFTVGDHWTFNLGLRADDQTHMNDAGEVIYDFTRVAPRLTLVYDVKGDGKMLVTGGAGRYYDWIPMELTQRFNTVPQGRAEYDQYGWYAPLQDYLVPHGHLGGAANIAENSIEPTWKDEATLGFEWAFSPNWAFKANALWYEITDQYSTSLQVVEVDGVRTTPNVFQNLDFARQERKSLSLVLRRRFRNNWTMTASYTLSETDGNCFTRWFNMHCLDSFGKLTDVTNDDGVPLTVVNRDGYMPNHLPHSFKVRGNYLIPLGGRHTLNVGGFVQYQSGRRWQMIADRLDVEGAQDVIEYLEPAGSRSLGSVYNVDLNASWRFPLGKGIQGSFGFEIRNATNSQKQMNVSDPARRSGEAEDSLSTGIVQGPRSYLGLASISF